MGRLPSCQDNAEDDDEGRAGKPAGPRGGRAPPEEEGHPHPGERERDEHHEHEHSELVAGGRAGVQRDVVGAQRVTREGPGHDRARWVVRRVRGLCGGTL